MKTALLAALTGLIATPGIAATIIDSYATPIEVTSGFQFLDANADGANDVNIVAQSGSTGSGQMVGTSTRNEAAGYYSVTSILSTPRNGGPLFDAVALGYGVSVDAAIAASMGAVWSSGERSYLFSNQFGGGAIPNVGDRAFVGLKLDYFSLSPDRDGCNGCEFGFEQQLLETRYAWLDLEHGSVVIHGTGYGDGPGVAAVTPTLSNVPLPAGLPLMLAGLGSLVWMRKRPAQP